MANLKNSVKKLLHDRFPGAEVKIDAGAAADRIHGTIIWRGFVGLDQVDRQRRVREAVRSALPQQEQLKVGALLTLTPDEIAVMRAG